MRSVLGAALLLAACEPDPVIAPRWRAAPVVPYPEELWDAGVEGETVLRVFVTTSGRADSVQVDRSSGYESFDRAARQAASGILFEPGRRGDEPAAGWVRIPVQFRLQTEAK